MVEFDLTSLDLPRLALDERLAGIVEAANRVIAAQTRLRALLRANQVLAAELGTDGLLHAVVQGAREITGARYAALVVAGEHGAVEQFVHVGMDDATARTIGHPPRGTGLIGAMIADPRPVRIPDLATDPRTAGVPAGHPALHDLLAVPIPVRGTVYGTLYLSGAPDAFTEEDEQLLRSFAAAAGFAIENARLYEEAQKTRDWAEASAEITALLLDRNESDAITVITDRIHHLTGATSTFVLLVAGDDRDRVEVVAVRGADPNHVGGTVRALTATIAERAIRTGEPDQLGEEELRALRRSELDAFGQVLVLPLSTSTRTTGALVVTRPPGSRLFTGTELSAATDFAGRAAVALELLSTRVQERRIAVLEDRRRVAKDLHDRVLQQLFGTAMDLQGEQGGLPAGRAADRVEAAVASLDEVILQVRQSVYTLHAPVPEPAPGSLQDRVLAAVTRQAAALGITPTVTMSGPAGWGVGADLAEDVLAVVSEGISNAVKHAPAGPIVLAVTVAQDVTVTVTNTGPPPDGDGRRSGLRNLERRAERRDGAMSLDAADGRTVLTWNVPRELVRGG